MTIADRIQLETQKKKEEFEKKPEFQSLRDFYSEMQSLGIAKKPEYNMPPLDTIGRRLYETAHSSAKKNLLVLCKLSFRVFPKRFEFQF